LIPNPCFNKSLLYDVIFNIYLLVRHYSSLSTSLNLKRTYQTSGIEPGTRLAVFCTILQELFNEVVNVYHTLCTSLKSSHCSNLDLIKRVDNQSLTARVISIHLLRPLYGILLRYCDEVSFYSLCHYMHSEHSPFLLEYIKKSTTKISQFLHSLI